MRLLGGRRALASRVPPLVCALTLTLSASCAVARADVFKTIQLVSDEHVVAGGLCVACEQALYARDPTISGNGQYVAFDGYMRGVTGVWRRDLATGVVEPVSVGVSGSPAGEAELPSISENGQYVSFTTLAALSPSDDKNVGPDVYVRDMDVPESQACAEEAALIPAQPCAFTLVSALSGSRQGLTYEPPAGEEASYGAMAAGRSAMSANGEKVVFVTTAPSDLQGEGAPETPALEVAVRNLKTGATELVSVEYDPTTGKPIIEDGVPRPVQPAVSGETYSAVYTASGKTPQFTPSKPYVLTPQVPASISADGSTVAWLAQDVGEQAPTLAEEPLSPKYSAPLWRRIDDGEEAPTRLVTGGADPANPACIASGETHLPLERTLSDPCQGPFRTEAEGVWTGGLAGDTVPRLSANGGEVAFLANVPPVARGSDFGLSPTAGTPADLYVVDMHEGLSRVQALTPLTELAGGEATKLAQDGPIVDFGISPNGDQVAFTTKRIVFPLGFPAYVSTPSGVPGLLELFDADLEDGTLTRVTHGYEGGAGEHPHFEDAIQEDQYEREDDGALSPSFSNTGSDETLAFASTASNLVYGDGNTPPVREENFDGSDVFLVQREVFTPEPTPQAISAAPASPATTTPWRLHVTAVSLGNGSVRLYVELPGAGTLRALASTAVAVRVTSASHGARASANKARRGHEVTVVRNRQVASAAHAGAPDADGFTTLTLTLTASYRSLAARAGGLSATASLSFSAPGKPALRTSIDVLFHKKAAARHSAHKRARPKTKRHKRR